MIAQLTRWAKEHRWWAAAISVTMLAMALWNLCVVAHLALNNETLATLAAINGIVVTIAAVIVWIVAACVWADE